MKKYLLFLLLLIPLVCMGAVDTWDGVTGVDTWDGQTGVDTSDGMEHASDGGTDYTADANCQGAWLFADNLNDSSGEGNTLSVASGSPAYSTTRPDGYSTGKSMLFTVEDSDALSRANADLSANFPGKASKADFAVSFWIYLNSRDYGTAGILQLEAGSEGWGIQERWGAWGVRIEDTGNNGQHSSIGTTATGDWYHVVVSFDGSDNEVTMWTSTDGGSFGDTINGGTTDFGSVANSGESPEDFLIGYKSTLNYLDGYLYQPVVFDKELNATEAEELYTTGITGAD